MGTLIETMVSRIRPSKWRRCSVLILRCLSNGVGCGQRMRGRKRRPKRRGYVRPSRAKPKMGWSLRELANLSGVTGRTIRLYLQRAVLPRPRFMGSATRYHSEQLLWLLAIRRLRSAERLTLSAIRARLQALTPADLKTFATENLPAGPLADVLGVRCETPPASIPPWLSPVPHGENGASLWQVPRWGRFELALGLELHVRDDASAPVLDMARRLRELCASGWPTTASGVLSDAAHAAALPKS
jgi:DNA-binding transcriptional MerR regulator